MKIESITISGFRCFDEAGVTIRLDDFNCFIGPNASGKTAAMMALGRLFSDANNQRQIVLADFHLKAGEDIKAKSTRKLFIECRIKFPEFENGDDIDSAAIPEAFNQMIVDEPGGTPYCRMRLDATWTNDGTPTGDIEQGLWWILINSDDPAVEDGNRRKIQARNRAQIRVVYIPAARDPEQQIRATTTTSFGRLLDSLSWNGADTSIKEKLMALQSELAALPAIKTINSKVQTNWENLYNGRVAHDVMFQALEEDPASLLDHLIPTFRPGEDGRTIVTRDLSDGLRSLFSFALSLGLFRVEESIRADATTLGFRREIAEKIPALTFFAVEEPENHLSPHYLGRVMSQLIDAAKTNRSQVILSSHCPSILGRVIPDRVRYFLGNEKADATKIKTLPLPEDETDEAFKYVREAVRGFPELYFSRLVVLAEGPSEEIVLRRLFEAHGTPLDTHFISIVPLGGRHVHHFWRLLQGLEIPFITLLDLDREKEGAGWGRVQYVRDQLVKRFGIGSRRLQVQNEDGDGLNLLNDEYNGLRNKPDTDIVEMEKWLNIFREHFDVYFSVPLDLDFAMLEAFPAVYKALAPSGGGPRLPARGTPSYQQSIETRVKQVLAADPSDALEDLGLTFAQSQKELFAWYKYLFLDRSKPVAHMRALLNISPEDLVEKAPLALRQLVQRARSLV